LPVNKNNVGAVRTKSVTARTIAQTVTAQMSIAIHQKPHTVFVASLYKSVLSSATRLV